MADSRLERLRRRVEADPASIAFAQLAEEYRRAGDCDEAVRVGRAGLAHHPTYLSARVTLGRALTALGRLDEARVELEYIVRVAPDNLAAIRGLADLHQRQGRVAAEVAADEVAADVAPGVATDVVPPEPEIAPPVPGADDVGGFAALGPFEAEDLEPAPARESSFGLGLPGGRVEDSEIWAGADEPLDDVRPGSILGLSGPRRRPAPVEPESALEPLERWLAAARAVRRDGTKR